MIFRLAPKFCQSQIRSPKPALAVALMALIGCGDMATNPDVFEPSPVVRPAHGAGLYFLEPIFYPVEFRESSPATRITAADIDGDGNLDVLASAQDDSRLAVGFGRGDGTYENIRTLELVFALNQSKCAMDLDLNGSADLAFFDGDPIYLLLGGRSQRFLGTQSAKTGVDIIAVTCADLDGDGLPDLIAADKKDGISIAHNLGNRNGFLQFKDPLLLSFGMPVEAVSAADFNRDGQLDLIVRSTEQMAKRQVLATALGTRDGSFIKGKVTTPNERVDGMAIGDLTGDGIPDLLTAQAQQTSVRLMPGTGDGGFASASQLPVLAQLLPAPAIADLDGDGILDVIVPVHGAIAILRGVGAGRFEVPRLITFRSPSTLPTDLSIADLDHDGRLDIVAATAGVQGGIQILLNDTHIQ